MLPMRAARQIGEFDLLGRWQSRSRDELCDYSFESSNHFTCLVWKGGQASAKVCGYWDVRENHLRIGTSPEDAESGPISAFEDNHFRVTLPGGALLSFYRS